MSDRPKGIVNPWLVVDPARAPARRARAEGRIDLDDIDRDSDLEIPGKYVIRTKHVAFAITSTRMETPGDALGILADLIIDAGALVTQAVLEAAGIGARRGTRVFNAPSDGVPVSTMNVDTTTIWFARKDLDTGARALGRILDVDTLGPLRRKHGVVVMLSG